MKPARVFDIDLTDETAAFPAEAGYNRHRILLRANRRPFGWVQVETKNDSITREEIYRAAKKHLGRALEEQDVLQRIYKEKTLQAFPGISVIVCTRNRTAQLATCLEALMKLEYPHFEVIVVDNAPSHNETEILVRTMPIVYVFEPRPGLNWARNAGLQQAKYPIVAFTDDDVKVDRHWLHTIAKIFEDPEVMGASGFVAPAEMETYAQHLFETGFGGMGHGFRRKYLKKTSITRTQLLWASSFGIGANMAFRRDIFKSIGGFYTALDVGTPSHGGGDVEFFHRLVNNDHLFVYEPSMMIWHFHRRDEDALQRQIYDNGRSFGCYLIHCFLHKTVNRAVIAKFLVKDWFFNWNFKNLVKPRNIPRRFSLAELKGMLFSPVAYWNTITNDKKIRQQYHS